jgi:predicted nucleotidyltransferase
MTDTIESLLDQLLERVTDKFTPERIVLFGSRAGGAGGPDSDIDVLIVMDVDGSTRRIANAIDLLMADRTVPMDFLVLTPEQYERQRHLKGTVVYAAERQGRVIYERVA